MAKSRNIKTRMNGRPNGRRVGGSLLGVDLMTKDIKTEPVSQLKDPGALMRPAPFWSWNDKLDEAELRRQIREMADKGWGSFFMHSRVGLVTGYLSDEWMSLVNACIDEAAKTGTEPGSTTRINGLQATRAVKSRRKTRATGLDPWSSFRRAARPLTTRYYTASSTRATNTASAVGSRRSEANGSMVRATWI